MQVPALAIDLQPKQSALYRLIKHHPAPVIGVGGGRGAAKSSGADRCVITLMSERKLLACMVMRNADQILRYHIEPIARDFPALERNVKKSFPAKLRIGKSELDFSYAETYDDIERRFRSANYDLIILDQAEQFTEREMREMRKAARSKGGGLAKFVLLFNMRGSAGIQTLRKWFHTHEVNKDEDPDDYVFLKFNPWDNVQWVLSALAQDGYSVAEYYSWTDEQRKSYAAANGPYTKQLASDDEVIRKADWDGDWDSIEGAYFASSFDLEATRITDGKVWQLHKPWARHWIAQDWGRSHWCVTYWFYRVALSPDDAKKYLGWELVKPINLSVVYRELIVSDMESTEVGQAVVNATPASEREKIRSFFLSPDAFGKKDSANTIALKEGAVLKPQNMATPTMADNDRMGGYGLMGALFKAAKGQGWGVDENGQRYQYDDAALISTECPELLKSIPALMRDPKNIDDVLKTDKSAAKIEQDCGDAVRYGLKSMLSPRKKTAEDEYQEQMQVATAPQRMMIHFRHTQKAKVRSRPALPPSWKGRS